MPTETYSMKLNGKKVLFSRPYLNEDRELTFLYCNEFTRFPNTEFVLSESQKAIELRNKESKKKIFLLLKGNEHLLSEATKKKESILELLKKFTQSMRSGEEKVIVMETTSPQYPYYFTTETIWKHGSETSKFITGFMYFVNQSIKSEESKFNSYDIMQRRFGEHFKEVGFKKFQQETIDGEKVYTISFNKFMELLN